MSSLIKPTLVCALAAAFAAPAAVAEVSVQIEIPRIDTAEYHRPYVAAWLESADRQTVRDIALWYEQDKPKAEGRQWLKDLRQWWRVSGRSQDVPADGVSGATRPVGTHEAKIPQAVLADLPAGQYNVVVEAAREKGGRELVRLPLAWPVTEASTTGAQGKTELGKIALQVQP